MFPNSYDLTIRVIKFFIEKPLNENVLQLYKIETGYLWYYINNTTAVYLLTKTRFDKNGFVHTLINAKIVP